METRKTIVRNVLTKKEMTFVNSLSLTDNIINYIMLEKKESSNILNAKRRKIHAKHIEEGISQINNKGFAYCNENNLIAKHI